MSDTGSSSLGSNSDIEDPGRDPKALNPPRNPLGRDPHLAADLRCRLVLRIEMHPQIMRARRV